MIGAVWIARGRWDWQSGNVFDRLRNYPGSTDGRFWKRCLRRKWKRRKIVEIGNKMEMCKKNQQQLKLVLTLKIQLILHRPLVKVEVSYWRNFEFKVNRCINLPGPHAPLRDGTHSPSQLIAPLCLKGVRENAAIFQKICMFRFI